MESPSETPPQPPAVPPASTALPAAAPSPEPEPKRSNVPFWLATGAILLPGLVALSGNDEAGVIAAFVLAPLGGIVAGIFLGIRIGKTTASKTLLSLGLILACFVAAEAMAIAGCNFGGFKMHIQ